MIRFLQKCISRGIHLAVVDVMFKEPQPMQNEIFTPISQDQRHDESESELDEELDTVNDDETSDECYENVAEAFIQFKDLIGKVRKVMTDFKNSLKCRRILSKNSKL